MANNNITKVSLALLPLNDLAQYLNIAEDFATKSDIIAKVSEVSGVLSGLMSEDDPTSVRNAENLGNKPAADYMTKDEGGQIVTDSVAIKTVYSSEIRDLRDELYQLRAELAKSGVVSNFKPYAGFSDLFRTNDAVHMSDIIAFAAFDSPSKSEIIVQDDLFGQFDVGDWIVLHIKSASEYHVTQITEMRPDGQTIVFSPSAVPDIKANDVDIYKSVGETLNGAFCFLKQATDIPDSIEKYSCLDDDTFRQRRKITSKNVGFGYTFRIPDAQKGFLVKFDIQAKTYGTPGALMCYIIDETKIGQWRNPKQAEEAGIILAKSQPLTHSADYGERIVSFKFWDGDKFPLLNEPDTSERTVRYCAIIEALDADADNNYDIVFLQHKRQDGEKVDLQLNNITYVYERKDENAIDGGLKTDTMINASDLYYGIATRGVVNNGFVPHCTGLYSAKFKTSEVNEVSRARISMRINREGYYTTNIPLAGAFNDNASLPVKKADGLTYEYDMNALGGFGLKTDSEDVIIGTAIRRISAQNASGVVLTKGMYAEPNQPVYRAGYKITLKAKCIEWNAAQCKFITTDSIKIDLPLVSVMADTNKKNARLSDRLIYEADLSEEDVAATRRFNDFELQIHWHTEYSGMYKDDKYKADFVGKIHDLVVSLDRNI